MALDSSTTAFLSFFRVISYLKIMRVAKVIEMSKKIKNTHDKNIKTKKKLVLKKMKRGLGLVKSRRNKITKNEEIELALKYINDFDKLNHSLNIDSSFRNSIDLGYSDNCHQIIPIGNESDYIGIKGSKHQLSNVSNLENEDETGSNINNKVNNDDADIAESSNDIYINNNNKSSINNSSGKVSNTNNTNNNNIEYSSSIKLKAQNNAMKENRRASVLNDKTLLAHNFNSDSNKIENMPSSNISSIINKDLKTNKNNANILNNISSIPNTNSYITNSFSVFNNIDEPNTNNNSNNFMSRLDIKINTDDNNGNSNRKLLTTNLKSSKINLNFDKNNNKKLSFKLNDEIILANSIIPIKHYKKRHSSSYRQTILNKHFNYIFNDTNYNELNLINRNILNNIASNTTLQPNIDDNNQDNHYSSGIQQNEEILTLNKHTLAARKLYSNNDEFRKLKQRSSSLTPYSFNSASYFNNKNNCFGNVTNTNKIAPELLKKINDVSVFSNYNNIEGYSNYKDKYKCNTNNFYLSNKRYRKPAYQSLSVADFNKFNLGNLGSHLKDSESIIDTIKNSSSKGILYNPLNVFKRKSGVNSMLKIPKNIASCNSSGKNLQHVNESVSNKGEKAISVNNVDHLENANNHKRKTSKKVNKKRRKNRLKGRQNTLITKQTLVNNDLKNFKMNLPSPTIKPALSNHNIPNFNKNESNKKLNNINNISNANNVNNSINTLNNTELNVGINLGHLNLIRRKSGINDSSISNKKFRGDLIFLSKNITQNPFIHKPGRNTVINDKIPPNDKDNLDKEKNFSLSNITKERVEPNKLNNYTISNILNTNNSINNNVNTNSSLLKSNVANSKLEEFELNNPYRLKQRISSNRRVSLVPTYMKMSSEYSINAEKIIQRNSEKRNKSLVDKINKKVNKEINEEINKYNKDSDASSSKKDKKRSSSNSSNNSDCVMDSSQSSSDNSNFNSNKNNSSNKYNSSNAVRSKISETKFSQENNIIIYSNDHDDSANNISNFNKMSKKSIISKASKTSKAESKNYKENEQLFSLNKKSNSQKKIFDISKIKEKSESKINNIVKSEQANEASANVNDNLENIKNNKNEIPIPSNSLRPKRYFINISRINPELDNNINEKNSKINSASNTVIMQNSSSLSNSNTNTYNNQNNMSSSNNNSSANKKKVYFDVNSNMKLLKQNSMRIDNNFNSSKTISNKNDINPSNPNDTIVISNNLLVLKNNKKVNSNGVLKRMNTCNLENKNNPLLNGLSSKLPRKSTISNYNDNNDLKHDNEGIINNKADNKGFKIELFKLNLSSKPIKDFKRSQTNNLSLRNSNLQNYLFSGSGINKNNEKDDDDSVHNNSKLEEKEVFSSIFMSPKKYKMKNLNEKSKKDNKESKIDSKIDSKKDSKNSINSVKKFFEGNGEGYFVNNNRNKKSSFKMFFETFKKGTSKNNDNKDKANKKESSRKLSDSKSDSNSNSNSESNSRSNSRNNSKSNSKSSNNNKKSSSSNNNEDSQSSNNNENQNNNNQTNITGFISNKSKNNKAMENAMLFLDRLKRKSLTSSNITKNKSNNKLAVMNNRNNRPSFATENSNSMFDSIARDIKDIKNNCTGETKYLEEIKNNSELDFIPPIESDRRQSQFSDIFGFQENMFKNYSNANDVTLINELVKKNSNDETNTNSYLPLITKLTPFMKRSSVLIPNRLNFIPEIVKELPDEIDDADSNISNTNNKQNVDNEDEDLGNKVNDTYENNGDIGDNEDDDIVKKHASLEHVNKYKKSKKYLLMINDEIPSKSQNEINNNNNSNINKTNSVLNLNIQNSNEEELLLNKRKSHDNQNKNINLNNKDSDSSIKIRKISKISRTLVNKRGITTNKLVNPTNNLKLNKSRNSNKQTQYYKFKRRQRKSKSCNDLKMNIDTIPIYNAVLSRALKDYYNDLRNSNDKDRNNSNRNNFYTHLNNNKIIIHEKEHLLDMNSRNLHFITKLDDDINYNNDLKDDLKNDDKKINDNNNKKNDFALKNKQKLKQKLTYNVNLNNYPNLKKKNSNSLYDSFNTNSHQESESRNNSKSKNTSNHSSRNNNSSSPNSNSKSYSGRTKSNKTSNNSSSYNSNRNANPVVSENNSNSYLSNSDSSVSKSNREAISKYNFTQVSSIQGNKVNMINCDSSIDQTNQFLLNNLNKTKSNEKDSSNPHEYLDIINNKNSSPKEISLFPLTSKTSKSQSKNNKSKSNLIRNRGSIISIYDEDDYMLYGEEEALNKKINNFKTRNQNLKKIEEEDQIEEEDDESKTVRSSRNVSVNNILRRKSKYRKSIHSNFILTNANNNNSDHNSNLNISQYNNSNYISNNNNNGCYDNLITTNSNNTDRVLLSENTINKNKKSGRLSKIVNLSDCTTGNNNFNRERKDSFKSYKSTDTAYNRRKSKLELSQSGYIQTDSDISDIEYDYVPGLVDANFSNHPDYQEIYNQLKFSQKKAKLKIEKLLFEDMTLKIVMLIIAITISLQITQEGYVQSLFENYEKSSYCKNKFSTLVSLAYNYEIEIVYFENLFNNTNNAENTNHINNPFISTLKKSMLYCFKDTYLVPEILEYCKKNNIDPYHYKHLKRILDLYNNSNPEETVVTENPFLYERNYDYLNGKNYTFIDQISSKILDNTSFNTFFLLVNLTNYDEYKFIRQRYPAIFPPDVFFAHKNYYFDKGMHINTQYYYTYLYQNKQNYIELLVDQTKKSFIDKLMNILRSIFVTFILVGVSYCINNDMTKLIMIPITKIIKKFRYFLHKSTFDYYEELINADNEEEEILLNKQFGTFSYYFDLTIGKRALSLIHQVDDVNDSKLSLNLKTHGFSFLGTALIIDIQIVNYLDISSAIDQINKIFTIFHSLAYGFNGEILNESIVIWKHKEDLFESNYNNYSRRISKNKLIYFFITFYDYYY